MSLTYSTYVTAIAEMIAQDPTQTDYVAIVPRMIEYAEGRIYRELDLLGTNVRDTSTTLAAGTRDVTVPTNAAGRFRLLNGLNVIISSSRTPLTPVTLEVLDTLWPSATAPSTTSVPQYYAYTTDYTIAVGPTLGSGAGTATMEFIGRVTPTALSNSNTTTYLTNYYPDLFLAASMIFISGYMRNFGAGSDNPQMAQSWEAQYGALLASADKSEARRRFASASWTSAPLEPNAQPQRG